MCLCIVSLCSGSDGCWMMAFCLISDEYSLRRSWSGGICISACKWCVPACTLSVSVLNIGFCIVLKFAHVCGGCKE